MPFVFASPSPDMPSGKIIFARAESAWHARGLPPYIEFTTFSEQISSDPVRVVIRTSDGKAFVETEPSSRRSKLYPGVQLEGPGGSPLGFCVSNLHCTGVLGADPFGGSGALGSSLRTIAAVTSFSALYNVDSAKAMDFDGTPVYDLQVTPRGDALRYRMRELIVDASTYRVWKMVYLEPENPHRVLVYGFGPVGDMWYLRQTCDAVPVVLSGLQFPACTEDVAMMWDYRFPEQVPDSDFVPGPGAPASLVISQQ